MAARKPLFMGTEGFSEEMAVSDSMTLGGLTMGGNVVMGANKITGLGDASGDGDAIGNQQTGAELGDLTITSGGDIDVAGGGELTGLPTVPSGSTAAASKAYVDGLISGIGWKAPVVTMSLKGNDTVANINGFSPSAGDAYVMTDAGVLTAGAGSDPTVAIGDLVEFDGEDWIILVTNSGGFVPVDTRAVLAEGTIASPYTDATDNDKIVAFTGSSNTGVATGDTVDKASVLVQDPGHIGYYDNLAFVYEGSVDSGTWIQFTGTGQINAGDGLAKDGNTLNVDLATNPGLQFSTAKLDLKLDGTTLQKGASGVSVKGLPSLFEVGGVAVGATVDAAALDTLTDGSNADGEHVHAASGITLAHSDLTGVTSDLHHAEAHSIASHNDTTATGTELETLTDGSNADSLHVHSTGVATEAPKVENTLTTATDATSDGDPVYANGSNTIGKSTAAVDAKARVIGVIRTGSGAAGATPDVVSVGPCAGVLSGATPGAPYYLGAAGGLSAALPGGGNRVLLMGFALNADDLFVMMRDYGKKAA